MPVHLVKRQAVAFAPNAVSFFLYAAGHNHIDFCAARQVQNTFHAAAVQPSIGQVS